MPQFTMGDLWLILACVFACTAAAADSSSLLKHSSTSHTSASSISSETEEDRSRGGRSLASSQSLAGVERASGNAGLQTHHQHAAEWSELLEGLEQHDRSGRHLLQSNRVAGVGTGIFIFFLFLAFCVFLCAVGTRTKVPWVIFTVSTIILVIVILALFASPRGDPPVPPSTGYDRTIGGLITVMVLLCVGILLAGVGFVGIVATEQHYARPLQYQTDVDVLLS